MKFHKRPVVIEATQWWSNGDHPQDNVGEYLHDPISGTQYRRIEGAVVGFFRHPSVDGQRRHCDVRRTGRPNCTAVMNDHGWIDTIEGGHTVCPGDWIITGALGERYPCEPEIFHAAYEPVACAGDDS